MPGVRPTESPFSGPRESRGSNDSQGRLNFPLISIVIVNFNGRRFIVDCLTTVLASDYPTFEIILVDNCSVDGSISLIKDVFGTEDRLRIVANSKNLGFAVGNNLGLAQASGDLIVFLNNDTQVDPEWLREIAEIFSVRREVGAAQCVLMQMRDRQRIQSTGSVLTQIGWPNARPRTRTSSLDPPNILACAAAFIVRRKIIDRIGGFDPDYFINFEDIDLSLRVWLSGHRVVLVQKSLVYHYDQGMHDRKYVVMQRYLREFHSSKNVIATLLKNFELKTLVRLFPPTLLFTLYRGFYMSSRRQDITTFSYTIKGLSWPIVNLRKILNRRHFVQTKVRTIPDQYVLERVYSNSNTWR